MVTHNNVLKRVFQLIALLIVWLIGGALIVLAVSTLIYFKVFLNRLSGHQILVPKLLTPIAIGIAAIAVVKLLCGAGLLWKRTRKYAVAALIILFIGFALATTAILFNHRVQAMIQKMVVPAFSLKVGEKVPPLVVKKIGDGKLTITYEGSEKTILLFFSTSCLPCKATVPYWNEQFANIDQKITPVIGLSESPEHELTVYIKEKKIRFPVYYLEDKAFMAKYYKLYAVPRKIEIDKSGTVISVEGAPEEVLKKLAKEKRKHR